MSLMNKIDEALVGTGVSTKTDKAIHKCFGTIIGYLKSLPESRGSIPFRQRIIDIIVQEMLYNDCIDSDRQVAQITEGVARAQEIIGRAVNDDIRAVNDDIRANIIAQSATKMPAVFKKKITAILKELPVLGIILEIAATKDIMIARKCITRNKLDAEEIHELVGLPHFHVWKTSKVQTIVINAIGMGGMTYLFVHFIKQLIKHNWSLFIVIVHDPNIIINHKDVLGTIDDEESGTSLTTMSLAEKKIDRVRDLI